MIDRAAVNELIAEWNQWRNIDHRFVNNAVPSSNKLDAAVRKWITEQDIDLLIKDLNECMAKDDSKTAAVLFDRLKFGIKEYQDSSYITILSNKN